MYLCILQRFFFHVFRLSKAYVSAVTSVEREKETEIEIDIERERQKERQRETDRETERDRERESDSFNVYHPQRSTKFVYLHTSLKMLLQCFKLHTPKSRKLVYVHTGLKRPFQCPSNDGHFADPDDCAVFYHCDNGVAYRRYVLN